MKRLLVFALILAAATATTLLLRARERGASPEVRDLMAALDSLIPAWLRQSGLPGAAVALIEQGEVVWATGYGYADRVSGRPVTSRTVFNVGSISKPVAAWGVLRLVDEGLLSLDRPVDDYLTRWRLPPSAFDRRGVTIQRLLSHTSGVSLHGYPGWPPDRPLPSLEESLDGKTNGAGGLRLERAPGTTWNYSGGGYTIAQLIVEEVTGMRFAEYMRTAILEPLGMDHSDFVWTPEVSRNAATPYDVYQRPIIGTRFVEQAAAGLQTTVVDLARFAAAALDGPQGQSPGRHVLRPETVRSMLTPVAPAPDWGLGYRILTDSSSGISAAGHGGSNAGWQAEFQITPDRGSGIVVLTNSSSGSTISGPVLCVWQQWNGAAGWSDYCDRAPSFRRLNPMSRKGKPSR